MWYNSGIFEGEKEENTMKDIAIIAFVGIAGVGTLFVAVRSFVELSIDIMESLDEDSDNTEDSDKTED